MQFDFGQNQEEELEIDFHNDNYIGICPKCSAKVFEHGMKYICEKTVGANKSCSFSSSKIILQQEISKEEFQKLTEQRKTSLLTNFKSSRTGRNFKAYLILKEDNTLGFEFEVKIAKPKAAKTTKIDKSEKNPEKSKVKAKKSEVTKIVKEKKLKTSKNIKEKEVKPIKETVAKTKVVKAKAKK